MIGLCQTGVLMCSVGAAAIHPITVICEYDSMAPSFHIIREARNLDFCETPGTTKAHLWSRFEL